MAVVAVMAMTEDAEAGEFLATTIRRLHHHFASHETASHSIFNGNHLWCKSIHHLQIDIQARSPEGYRGSIRYNVLKMIAKPIVKPIINSVISYVVRRYDEIWNARNFKDPMANLYMVIFSSFADLHAPGHHTSHHNLNDQVNPTLICQLSLQHWRQMQG
jgi:hypothetical protein